jgi:hypothetical protein
LQQRIAPIGATNTLNRHAVSAGKSSAKVIDQHLITNLHIATRLGTLVMLYALRASSGSLLLVRSSRPLSDQGKCATGMTKKL